MKLGTLLSGASLVVVFCLFAASSCLSPQTTQQTAPQTTEFASPDQAVKDFIAALRANDVTKLKQIFGPEAEEIMSSGDPIADQRRRAAFLAAYDAKNTLTPDPEPGTMTLVVGAQDWPLPIPIVKDVQTGQWFFDTDAGKEEIINRRIGQNELNVIQVCKALVDAEQEYSTRVTNADDVPEYTAKVLSDPGKHNGLYWETHEGEQPSPLGPFMAEAAEQGYSSAENTSGEPRPYHGYLYRIITKQGPNAPGGERDYFVSGRMIAGFAAVAYPADYGNSGIMTFMVNHDGVVYQKDLGDDTATIAKAITVFDPGPGWTKVEAKDLAAPPPSTSPATGANGN